MLDAKKRAKLDQAMATIVEFFPPIWAGLYRELTETENLPPVVALEMVKAFIMRPSDNAPDKAEPEEQ